MLPSDQTLLNFIMANFPGYFSIYLKTFGGAYLVDPQGESFVIDLHRVIAEWAEKQYKILSIGEE